MNKLSKKQLVAVAAGAAIAISTAGVAFAYWSTSGGGTGSATAGPGETNTLHVVQTNQITDLTPYGGPQTLSGTVSNSSSRAAHVNSITATVGTLTGGLGDLTLPPCTSSDFAIAGSSTFGADAATSVDLGGAGSETDTANWSGLTVELKDNNANQDNCRGASVAIDYVTH